MEACRSDGPTRARAVPRDSDSNGRLFFLFSSLTNLTSLLNYVGGLNRPIVVDSTQSH
jgi:hypothetical protein